MMMLIERMQRGIRATEWLGIPVMQNPLDSWIYQQIIYETSPDVVVELGTRQGGAALFLAHICDAHGKGHIITVDETDGVSSPLVKEHPRISRYIGNPVDIIDQLAESISETDRVMVIEDSSGSYEGTLDVLNHYARIVTPGSYMICENTILKQAIGEHHNPGPWDAVHKFVADNRDFEIDRSREQFFLTWNPDGFLKRR